MSQETKTEVYEVNLKDGTTLFIPDIEFIMDSDPNPLSNWGWCISAQMMKKVEDAVVWYRPDHYRKRLKTKPKLEHES